MDKTINKTYYIDDNHCAYCGDLSDTKDHIIPYSFNHSGKRKATFKDQGYNLVPCCRECNCIGSNKVFDDFYKKKEYIQKRLITKYQKVLNLAPWSDEEIEEMCHEFKIDLRISQLARKWILNRINYPVIVFEEQPIREELRDILSKFGL